MTIKGWLKSVKGKIPALDAELILLFVLKDVLPEGADRSYIFAHPEVGVSQGAWKKMDEMAERRAKGEPLAYILEFREFYGRDFRVSPEVLIPRPETESLVDLVLEVVDKGGDFGGGDLAKRSLEVLGGFGSDVLGKVGVEGGFAGKRLERASEWRILEIGTGSGCIATTLSLEMAARSISGAVTATDVSEGALAQARENAAHLGATVRFLRADLLSGVPMVEDFDVLVANLPYVDRGWGWLDFEGLDFEPELALYAEEKGLALYRRLFEELEGRVSRVVLEADPCQHKELIKIAEANGYNVDKVEWFGVRFRSRL